MISLPRVKINWSEPGIVVSGVAHAALLVVAVVSFADTKPFEDAQEAISVDVISASQLSQITRGEQTAKEVRPDPKPRVDKLADLHDTKPETAEPKRDVPTPPARPPEPLPEPKPAAIPAPPERPKDTAEEEKAKAEEKARAEADAKAKAEADKAAAARAEAAARAKAEADSKARAEAARQEAEALEKAKAAKAEAEAKAQAEAKARAEAKAKAEKAEAEARAKAEAEAEQKRKEAELARQRAAEAQKLAALAEQAKAETPKPPTPKPAPPRPEPKFDVSNIEKLLTSKEAPQQAPSTGREVNRTASLGAPRATGPKLSPSQRDALGQLFVEQISRCWSLPPGMMSVDNIQPKIRVVMNQDGSLGAEPVLVNSSANPNFRPVAESALRALKRCAPYKLPPQFLPSFEDWRDLVLTFDPKDML